MGEQEKTIRFGLRLPESLYNKLQEQAREHHLSLNSEIITLLSAGLRSNQILSQAEQFLSSVEREVRESEQRVYARGRETEERLKIYGAQVKALAADFQEIKQRTPILLNGETIDLIETARGVAERRGKSLGDLFDQALRKVVSEEEPA